MREATVQRVSLAADRDDRAIRQVVEGERDGMQTLATVIEALGVEYGIQMCG